MHAVFSDTCSFLSRSHVVDVSYCLFVHLPTYCRLLLFRCHNVILTANNLQNIISSFLCIYVRLQIETVFCAETELDLVLNVNHGQVLSFDSIQCTKA